MNFVDLHTNICNINEVIYTSNVGTHKPYPQKAYKAVKRLKQLDDKEKAASVKTTR